jgi:hypothetical protein
MSERQPSFATRRTVLAQAAQDLMHIADIVGDEANRMAAAEKRFAERRRKSDAQKADR